MKDTSNLNLYFYLPKNKQHALLRVSFVLYKFNCTKVLSFSNQLTYELILLHDYAVFRVSSTARSNGLA